VLGQRACCHRGCAKRNGRRNNKYYFAHERSSLGDAVMCKIMQLTAAKLSLAVSKNTAFKIHLRFRSDGRLWFFGVIAARCVVRL
jgi:hypothetical protein